MKVLLAVESDGLGFYFTILDIDLVSTEHNRYVLADSDQVLVPGWHVFVGDTRSHIEHDYSALTLNVVAISKTSELLLTGRVPHVECDRTSIGGERQWMHFHTQSG